MALVFLGVDSHLPGVDTRNRHADIYLVSCTGPSWSGLSGPAAACDSGSACTKVGSLDSEVSTHALVTLRASDCDVEGVVLQKTDGAALEMNGCHEIVDVTGAHLTTGCCVDCCFGD